MASKISNQENQGSALMKKVIFNKTWSTKAGLSFPACSDLRSKCIEWLYSIDRSLYIARSTLFLAIGLLDKIIARKFTINDSNYQLVAGSLLLLSTKFNEVYPITVDKLSSHSAFPYLLENYEECEANILEAVDFELTTDSNVYEDLAAFEAKFEGAELTSVSESVRIALMNPGIAFKMGTATLLLAVEGSVSAGLSVRNSNQPKEVSELKNELGRLKAETSKKGLALRA